jgi:Ca2+-binding EF-hand superfamily protein
MDLNGNGKIEYSEWLVATLNIENEFFKSKLYQAFEYFDKLKKGIISLENFKEVMGDNSKFSNKSLEANVFNDIMIESKID